MKKTHILIIILIIILLLGFVILFNLINDVNTENFTKIAPLQTISQDTSTENNSSKNETIEIIDENTKLYLTFRDKTIEIEPMKDVPTEISSGELLESNKAREYINELWDNLNVETIQAKDDEDLDIILQLANNANLENTLDFSAYQCKMFFENGTNLASSSLPIRIRDSTSNKKIYMANTGNIGKHINVLIIYNSKYFPQYYPIKILVSE